MGRSRGRPNIDASTGRCRRRDGGTLNGESARSLHPKQRFGAIHHLKMGPTPRGQSTVSDERSVANYRRPHHRFASKEAMSGAGSRVIDASDKSLLMFDLSCDPTLGNTTIMANVFNEIAQKRRPHIWHTFEEALYYLNSVNSASLSIRSPKPAFKIEKTAERRGRRDLGRWATIFHYIAEEIETGYIAIHSPGPNRNPKLTEGGKKR
jgi:hypothetical protein